MLKGTRAIFMGDGTKPSFASTVSYGPVRNTNKKTYTKRLLK